MTAPLPIVDSHYIKAMSVMHLTVMTINDMGFGRLTKTPYAPDINATDIHVRTIQIGNETIM